MRSAYWTFSNRPVPLTCAASPGIPRAPCFPRSMVLGRFSGRSLRMSRGPRTSTCRSWSLASRRMASISGGTVPRHASAKPVIESDPVEDTAVFDPEGHRIGTIKRLLIEKVSGHVVYVDVTFGGFLRGSASTTARSPGTGSPTIQAFKHTAPVSLKSRYVALRPSDGDDNLQPDRKREQELSDYWRDFPRGPTGPG